MKKRFELKAAPPFLVDGAKFTTPRQSLIKFQEGDEDEIVRFSGIAVAYNTPIDRGFVSIEIMPGAFATAVSSPDSVRILFQHKEDELIGRATLLEDRNEGLYIEFGVSECPQRGKEVVGLLRQNILQNMSIGFDLLQYEVIEATNDEEQTKIRVTEADLYEVSLVTFPADDNAIVRDELQKRFSKYNGAGNGSPCGDDDEGSISASLSLSLSRAKLAGASIGVFH